MWFILELATNKANEQTIWYGGTNSSWAMMLTKYFLDSLLKFITSPS